MVLVFGLGAWLLQIRLTKRDHFFDVKEMLRYHGVGLPMKWHFAIMWGDPFLLTPLCAVLIWFSKRGWSSTWDGLISLVAFALSGVVHYQYLQDKIENSHMHNGRFTPATPVHFVYMWVILTVVGHSYLREPHENAASLIATSVILLVHVVLGTHLIVKLRKPEWFTLGQRVADTNTLVVWVGAAAALAGLTAFNLIFVR